MIQHCALSLKVTGIHLQVLKKADVAALPPTIWLEDEGDIDCNDSHTVTETDKGSHPIEESSRPFQVEEHPRSLFQSEIVGGDDDIELDHNLLFYSVQSIENLDTMLPEISAKCTE